MTDPVSREVSYGRRLTDLAAERPDDADLVLVARDGAERPVTFRELELRANQIARLLESRGVRIDDVVGLALPNCLDHILVTLAIWKLGATLLPLRHDVPQWEMDRVLELAEPVCWSVTDTPRRRRSSSRAPISRKVPCSPARRWTTGPQSA